MLHVLIAITSTLHTMRRDERGATAVEYALIAGLCVLAFVASVFALQTVLGGVFGATQTSMNNSVH